MLLGTTQVSVPNGISFCPTSLAGCTSVTDDIHRDGQTDKPRYGNICRNMQNRFQWHCLKIWKQNRRNGRKFQKVHKAIYTNSEQEKCKSNTRMRNQPCGKPMTVNILSSWSWWYGLLVLISSCRQRNIGSDVSSSAKMHPIAQISATAAAAAHLSSLLKTTSTFLYVPFAPQVVKGW